MGRKLSLRLWQEWVENGHYDLGLGRLQQSAAEL